MRSPFFQLNARDLFKGAVLALLTALITGVYELLQAGAGLDWVTLKPVVLTSVMALLAYLLKNLFTNTQGEILTPEPK
jgi:hypothetical protein